jgi:hypothetical protein
MEHANSISSVDASPVTSSVDDGEADESISLSDPFSAIEAAFQYRE